MALPPFWEWPGRALDVARDLPGDELDQPLAESPTNQFPELLFLNLAEARRKPAFAVGDHVGPAFKLGRRKRAGDRRWCGFIGNWLAMGPRVGRKLTMAGHFASK